MKIYKYLILILITFLVSSCSTTGQSQTKDEGTQSNASNTAGPQERDLKILASSKYLAQMIQGLAGSDHIVNYMAETESQLKSLAPDPDLMEKENYNAFFYIGAGYEPFIREFTEKLDKNKINVVNVSRGIDILRHKINKLDNENYYYLTNSTNYKIALNSIKNSLQELDPGRKTRYDENFLVISQEIDEFQRTVRAFISKLEKAVFIVDSDLAAYVVQDYKRGYQTITEFTDRITSQELPATQPVATTGSTTGSTTALVQEKRIFLYTEDISILKYADEIIKYNLIPVKVNLYEGSYSIMAGFTKTFSDLLAALEN